MNSNRRRLLIAAGAVGLTASLNCFSPGSATAASSPRRRFRFAHIDVFTSQPLLGNPLDVILDARGMSDEEMLAVTRETYLSEATFIIPRDAETERKHGVRVRIFTPDGEVPFAGHPTLGTANVLRALHLAKASQRGSAVSELAEITLDLNVGKVPVTFRTDSSGRAFGEMRQVAPTFGTLHDKEDIARLHNLTSDDIADFGQIQTVSTGLPFAIVPLKRLSSLQSLRIDVRKMNEYTEKQGRDFGFYYLTRDTGDADVALRARCVYVGGEDAATGSAAGCAAAWLVRNGAAAPDESLHIRQGVEMKRTSDIFVRASRDGERIVNVRVGGYAVQTMDGEITL